MLLLLLLLLRGWGAASAILTPPFPLLRSGSAAAAALALEKKRASDSASVLGAAPSDATAWLPAGPPAGAAGSTGTAPAAIDMSTRLWTAALAGSKTRLLLGALLVAVDGPLAVIWEPLWRVLLGLVRL